jgi:Squalene-hopene cyclase C-terminal domain/HEAT repeats
LLNHTLEKQIMNPLLRFAFLRRPRSLLVVGILSALCLLTQRSNPAQSQVSPGPRLEQKILLPTAWHQTLQLIANQVVELSVQIPQPSQLPRHGRIGVAWSLVRETSEPQATASKSAAVSFPSRKADALEIMTPPTANWQKTLHALDPDVYVVYRAPVSGEYRLEVAPIAEGPTPFEGPRWRESGMAPSAVTFPRVTPWPKAKAVSVSISLQPFELGEAGARAFEIETEPNDTPEMAQRISLPSGEGIQRLLISAGADDIEYFDNGKVGYSGDDWFQFTYEETEPRLLTCNLAIPDQAVAARLRLYTLESDGKTPASEILARAGGLSGVLLPLAEYTEGRNENERVHQQNEGHRTEINRLLKPGGTYFLRAEANTPGYEIELRLLKPAPYTDVEMAIRQALYDHLAQVDAWLANRPRGASVERRIRDTGNLMGTHCMSCHTQSGVWGSAVAIQNGYWPENVQNLRRLINIMYESMRPTNYLKDAANNTSLAPLDVGDGPAGTRVAGHNVCTAEQVWPARKLHAMQAIRAANHVLQTADPSGINAAGPGSNVGQAVVYNYAGEIVRTAWDRTGHPRYLAALEEKAEKMLPVQPKFTDDLAHRIEFFKRFFPRDYLNQNQKAREAQQALPPEPPEPTPSQDSAKPGNETAPKPARFPEYKILEAEAATKLVARINEQLTRDEARLRAIQNTDGTWGFDPGKLSGDGKTWKTDGEFDPAPTALALIALQALGYSKDDPAISRGVQALLRTQDPYGRWNKSAQTGFVTTAYVLHALSRLYPIPPDKPSRTRFEPKPGETLRSAIARARSLSHSEDPRLTDLMIQAASHGSPFVRFWGVMGLGGVHQPQGVPALVKALGDPVKMVREAAAWAMEQTLLDDVGFDAVFAAYSTGDDLTRESVLKALGMRADAVMTRARLDKSRLVRLLERALNDDPHPGVRAWAAKTAWQWWVWNPPLRESIQQAWIRKLLSPEPNALVENCFRYQSQALFIANGHKANGSQEHQYLELTLLFKALEARLEDPKLTDSVKDRLARRLVATAGTFYNTTGGDGGPGQMGYVTPGSADLFGKAAFRHFRKMEAAKDLAGLQLVLEGSNGIPYPPLQDKLIDYSTHGPEELRTLAAAAVSDPSAVTLPGTQELVQPLVEQIHRGAQDYDRRQTLSQPVLKLFGRARWNVPKTVEQQDLLYSLLVPKYPKELDADSLAKVKEAAERAVQPMGQLDADWYLADRMGKMLSSNPDLHTDTLLKWIPETVRNPLAGHFWLPSVSWVLEYGDPVPEINDETTGDRGLPEVTSAARTRALNLYLQMLQPDATALSRNAAVTLANRTALRRQTAVLDALRKLLEFERSERLRQTAQNVLRTEPETWLADLREAVKADPLATALRGEGGDAKLTPEFLASFRYFSNYVAPELNRPQRMDEMACMSCHGVPGRVPSMQLEAPDGTGYFSVAKLLKNYLTLQQRINLTDIEQSKLLRKPLNVQTGKEDGHQGGRRYVPADFGYLIVRRWVLDQPRVQLSLAQPKGSGLQAGKLEQPQLAAETLRQREDSGRR